MLQRNTLIKMIFNQSNATCHIFTFKEGLLSLLAHDLKLKVSNFKIIVKDSLDGSSPWQEVIANFDTTSIQTVCAMKDDIEDLKILSKQDCVDINKNITNDILHSKKFSTIQFKSNSISGSADNFVIIGHLTICNVARQIKITIKQFKGQYQAKITLNQSDFNIKPFSALMGAMTIKPEVTIKIMLPCSTQPPTTAPHI